MNFKDLIKEKVSPEHRQNVLAAARKEMGTLSVFDFLKVPINQFSLASIFTALVAVIYVSQKKSPSPEGSNDPDIELLAFDPDMQEDAELLNDLDVIEELEELEKWTES